jgi:dihydroflavonol-4-reductase
VRRVVVTSSFAAIGYGHPASKQRFDENDWTIVDGPGVFPYQKSKTLAERAAWEFVRREGVGMELSVVNPVGIFGPVLGPDYSTSIVLLKRVLRGDVPGMPNFSFGIVDVRDVASLHRLAMVSPEAAGERFLSTTEHFIPAVEMAKILKERMGAQGRRVKVHVLPNFMIKLVALFDKGVAQVVPELGKVKDATSEKAQRVLGWQPRSVVEAIVSSGESLERLGLLKG